MSAIPSSFLPPRAELAHVAENTEAVALVVAVPLLEEVEKARGDLGRIAALQTGQAPTDALRRELIEFCRDAIAVYKLPREVEFVPQLPRAPGPAGPGTGKLLRRVLREQAGRG